MKWIDELHKNTDTAIYLGSGPSINDITTEQWKCLSRFDTFGINHFHYHHFVPRFYHIEIKERDMNIWKQRHREIEQKYKNVKFICRNQGIFIREVPGLNIFENTFVYIMDKRGEERRPVTNYKINTNLDDNTLVCVGGVSLSLVFNLFYKMKYSKIILFGTDMFSSRYFWTGTPRYGKTHYETNKDFEGKSPDAPHNTSHINHL